MSPSNTLFAQIIIGFLQVISLLIKFGYVAAFIAFVWGIVKYLARSDTDDGPREGLRLMTWGIIGFFVLLTIWGIVNFAQLELGVWQTSNSGLQRNLPGFFEI